MLGISTNPRARAPRKNSRKPSRKTSEEFTRLNGETLDLLAAGAKALAARSLERMSEPAQPPPLDRVRHEQNHAIATMTGTPRAERETQRRLCETLMLHRVCRRAACRKAHTCRGNPDACCRRADAPDAVMDFAVRLMLDERVPMLAITTQEEAPERLAYEGWIAALEVRERGGAIALSHQRRQPPRKP